MTIEQYITAINELYAITETVRLMVHIDDIYNPTNKQKQ